MTEILILGGTLEARTLAERLAGDFGAGVTYSLAGRTTAPSLPHCRVRTGGFGGVDGLVQYLETSATQAVVDATHPFAARMSGQCAEACGRAQVPWLRLERAAWRPEAGDHWVSAVDAGDAAAKLAGLGTRAFLTTGRKDLGRFVGVEGVWFLVRSIEPPDPPLPEAQFTVIGGRGPFSGDQERDLMREYLIDVVVAKNSGGGATSAKLAAARLLDIPVVMIERPPPAPGTVVGTVDEAARWVAETVS